MALLRSQVFKGVVPVLVIEFDLVMDILYLLLHEWIVDREGGGVIEPSWLGCITVFHNSLDWVEVYRTRVMGGELRLFKHVDGTLVELSNPSL